MHKSQKFFCDWMHKSLLSVAEYAKINKIGKCSLYRWAVLPCISLEARGYIEGVWLKEFSNIDVGTHNQAFKSEEA